MPLTIVDGSNVAKQSHSLHSRVDLSVESSWDDGVDVDLRWHIKSGEDGAAEHTHQRESGEREENARVKWGILEGR